jgi:ArsR family metal-binding transcriptional regulator
MEFAFFVNVYNMILDIYPQKFQVVKKIMQECVAQENMSPLMPKLKCPQERGKDLNEPEAVTEVSSCWVGRKWKNYFRGGCSENRGLLPASQANL